MPMDRGVEAEMRFLRWKLANSKGDEYKAALKRYMELKNMADASGGGGGEYQGGYEEQQPAESQQGGWGDIGSW